MYFTVSTSNKSFADHPDLYLIWTEPMKKWVIFEAYLTEKKTDHGDKAPSVLQYRHQLPNEKSKI